MEFNRRVAGITFLVGAASLTYELLQVRMLSFFLGKSMDILAIPIALFGLAVGSMLRHFLYKGEAKPLVDKLSTAVFPMMVGSFLVFFYVVNTWFPDIHIAISTPDTEATKVVLYSAIFLPPYVVFGALFATLFGEFADRIGRLYFFDLAGAALGCVLAPLMFTWFGLPQAILLCLLLTVGLWVLANRPSIAVAGVLGWLAVAGLATSGRAFVEQPNPEILARYGLRNFKDGGITEVDARWNEIARTSLLRAGSVPNKHGEVFTVVQDNGLSNVTPAGFNPNYRPDPINRHFHYALPFRLGVKPKRVLVMFAGMGRDMIAFDELTQGEAQITGVELNPTVVAWQAHPALAKLNLVAFHDRPNIDLRVREGRDFLNTDDAVYDIIYVANNGAVHASRTGHTRKFLDTYEAMDAYIDQLAPNGVMVFTGQPVVEKIASFRKIFADRGLAPAEQSILVFGPGREEVDSMVVKPSGFTEADLTVLDEQLAPRPDARALYRPGRKGIGRIQEIFDTPLDELEPITDDRPFTRRIDWDGFTLKPDPTQYWDPVYVSGWVKVFTVLLFALVSSVVALAAAALGTRDQRVPVVWVGYLLLTGIGYMCVEIALIAKTELFIGNPLYAVSVNLALFLVFNALGSYLQDERKIMKGPAHLALGVLLAVAWGLLSADFSVETLLSAAMPLKVLGVAVIVFPAGVVLGTFYPFCVSRLMEGNHRGAIPMTYGLTTLSSVLGSAFAMAAIINLGFTQVILLGATLYVLAVGLSLVAGRS